MKKTYNNSSLLAKEAHNRLGQSFPINHLDAAVNYVVGKDERLREVVDLRFLENIKPDEIAFETGLSLPVAKRMINDFLHLLCAYPGRLVLEFGADGLDDRIERSKDKAKAIAALVCNGESVDDELPADVLMLPYNSQQFLAENNITTVTQLAKAVLRGWTGMVCLDTNSSYNRLTSSDTRARAERALGITVKPPEESGDDMVDIEYARKVFLAVSGEPHTREIVNDIYIQGVLDAVKALPEDQRLAIELEYRYGMSRENSGSRLGLTSYGVKGLIRKAISSLQDPALFGRMRVSDIEFAASVYKNRIHLLNEGLAAKTAENNELRRRVHILETRLEIQGGDLVGEVALVQERPQESTSNGQTITTCAVKPPPLGVGI